MRGILVGREAGAFRRDLVEDAARLAEVDGEEPEAVDHLGRAAAGGEHALPPLLLLVHLARPGDVVARAGARDAGLVRRRLVLDPAVPRVAVRRPPRAVALEAERGKEVGGALLDVARVRAHALEAQQRERAPEIRG